ncbi:hypothetical protein [Marinibactrum halimedae]|uniref:Nuclease n=1 Tax=Marinibactrum halimedae TaxID=1444977 RepID=A0AA37T6M6_9GAMM|nr:hypothetical protein [Marinibactrum halimedae]MCD9460208.1 hypothetical protein [Marinibactrum halimedae]GLS27960.1 hypothetical protein GCM10007877_36790 [Marinibactrum halimedae]
MGKACEDKCVGQVIAATITLNGMPSYVEDQKAIQQVLSKAIKKAQKVAEEDAARKQNEGIPTLSSDVNREIQIEEILSTASSEERAEMIDNGVMCAISCCCDRNPAKGVGDQNLKQQCVDGVLKEADKAMNYKSRYKSEIWWNMNMETTGIPTPFMHRDKNGADTTEPSHFPMGRIKEIEGFEPSQGYLRRTDVVIVSDSERPPGEDNIDSVVEMKFGKDSRDFKQDQAYIEIAGGKDKYQVYRIGEEPEEDEERLCNCHSPMLPLE